MLLQSLVQSPSLLSRRKPAPGANGPVFQSLQLWKRVFEQYGLISAAWDGSLAGSVLHHGVKNAQRFPPRG